MFQQMDCKLYNNDHRDVVPRYFQNVVRLQTEAKLIKYN